MAEVANEAENESPWWAPVPVDAAWFARVRYDYPESTAVTRRTSTAVQPPNPEAMLAMRFIAMRPELVE